MGVGGVNATPLFTAMIIPLNTSVVISHISWCFLNRKICFGVKQHVWQPDIVLKLYCDGCN